MYSKCLPDYVNDSYEDDAVLYFYYYCYYSITTATTSGTACYSEGNVKCSTSNQSTPQNSATHTETALEDDLLMAHF